jgi:hypothetical protein
MKGKLSKIIILFIIIFLIYLGYRFIFQKDIYQKDIYRGIFYPNGCLTCDNFIVSPNLSSAEDCVIWAEALMTSRKNPDDLWECGKNCKWENGLSVCELTFGMEGAGLYYIK